MTLCHKLKYKSTRYQEYRSYIDSICPLAHQAVREQVMSDIRYVIQVPFKLSCSKKSTTARLIQQRSIIYMQYMNDTPKIIMFVWYQYLGHVKIFPKISPFLRLPLMLQMYMIWHIGCILMVDS